MANNVLDWVWDHSRSRHGARLVMLAIADRADDRGNAWPSVPDIMRRTQLGERAVQAGIIEAAKLGELEVGYQEGPKGCNRYRIVMVRPPAISAGAQGSHPASSAPPQYLRGSESSQVNGQYPADSAPPAISAPPQISTATPANSADEPSIEPSEPKASRPRRDLNAGREDVERLCVHLADRISANGYEQPDITKGWRDSARLMLDVDKRREEQVHRAIDWSQSNEFWRKNVRSMPTLREKYVRLQMEADDERKRGTNGQAGMRGGARQPILSAGETAALDPGSIV